MSLAPHMPASQPECRRFAVWGRSAPARLQGLNLQFIVSEPSMRAGSIFDCNSTTRSTRGPRRRIGRKGDRTCASITVPRQSSQSAAVRAVFASVDKLDICRNTVEVLIQPDGGHPLHSAQPAFTQSLRVQEVLVMTLAPPMPVSQRQLNSRRTIQSECCFRRDKDHGVDHTKVRRSCAEL
jgi:hypothetical protein